MYPTEILEQILRKNFSRNSWSNFGKKIEKILGQINENISLKISTGISREVSERLPGRISEGCFEKIIKELCGGFSIEVLIEISERIPKFWFSEEIPCGFLKESMERTEESHERFSHGILGEISGGLTCPGAP